MSEPSKFVVQRYANVGTKEAFTAAFLGLRDLVDAASFDLPKKEERGIRFTQVTTKCSMAGSNLIA